MSVDSHHYYLHCANEDIFNCATLALGEGDAHVFKHSIPYPSYYTKIKDFTKFSHFKMLRDGTASYNLNHCRCDSCEKGDSCLHPLQKGEMHELEMNKVEAKGGTVTTTTSDATKTKAMELTANTNNVVTTISENGTEDRKLSNGTIVVSFVWNEEAERSLYRVGIIMGGNKSNSVTFAIIFFQEDVNEPGCYRKPTDGIEFVPEATFPETILLATVTGSKTVPDKIVLDPKIMDMVHGLLQQEEDLHQPPLEMPEIYGRGQSGNIPLRLWSEEG
jgi:hypothetical protein